MNLSQEDLDRIGSTSDLTDTLGILLNERRPQEITDHFSENGGWPDDEEYEVISIEEGDNEIRAECNVSFNELETSGCPEMPRRYQRGGKFAMIIDAAGDVCFEYEDEAWAV